MMNPAGALKGASLTASRHGSLCFAIRIKPQTDPSQTPDPPTQFVEGPNIGDAMFRDKQMKGAHAAIVVGDLTRRDTMVHQLQLAQKFSDEFPGRYLVGVLNKTDLNNDVPEDKDHIPEGLRKGFFPICHTSAKTGENVAQTFVDAAKTIARRNL